MARNINEEHDSNITTMDRIACWVSNRVGTSLFFVVIVLWTITWLTWNAYAPRMYQFDAAPGYIRWLFISNCIQIFLMPLVLVSQNIDSKRQRLLAEKDYELDMWSEQMILDIRGRLSTIEQKLEVDTRRSECKDIQLC